MYNITAFAPSALRPLCYVMLCCPNCLRLAIKSCNKKPKFATNKCCKVAKMSQKLQQEAKICNKKMLQISKNEPKVATGCQKLPKIAKSCQKLPKVAKSSQK